MPEDKKYVTVKKFIVSWSDYAAYAALCVVAKSPEGALREFFYFFGDKVSGWHGVPDVIDVVLTPRMKEHWKGHLVSSFFDGVYRYTY